MTTPTQPEKNKECGRCGLLQSTIDELGMDCVTSGSGHIYTFPVPKHEKNKSADDILREFDEKFSPEWWTGFSGDMELNAEAIETIKAFLKQALHQAIDAVIVEKDGSICSCGCNFGDGCLCREGREGYNTARQEQIRKKDSFFGV